MSIWVAAQSAVFYFAACTPCVVSRRQYKTRQKAKQDKEEKQRMEADNPEIYSQPLPFNTNPYWSEEITMGPRLPKKSNSKNGSQRRLTSAGNESSIASSLMVGGSTINQTNLTNPEASPTIVASDADTRLSRSTSLGEDWNKKRYQREDEELWGTVEAMRTSHKLRDALAKASSSAGRLLEKGLGFQEPREKTISEEDRHNFYSAPTIPPVNDYHPPVINSRPMEPDAHKWMLQPPPSAKFMEGKVRRSGSGASQASNRTRMGASDNVELGRLVHAKVVEAKLRNGESPTDLELPPSVLTQPASSRRTTASSGNARSTRSGSSSSASESTGEAQTQRKKKRRPPPLAETTNVDADDEDSDVETKKTPSGSPARAAQRPRLETITSSGIRQSASDAETPTKSRAGPRTPLSVITNTHPGLDERAARPHTKNSPVPQEVATPA